MDKNQSRERPQLQLKYKRLAAAKIAMCTIFTVSTALRNDFRGKKLKVHESDILLSKGSIVNDLK